MSANQSCEGLLIRKKAESRLFEVPYRNDAIFPAIGTHATASALKRRGDSGNRDHMQNTRACYDRWKPFLSALLPHPQPLNPFESLGKFFTPSTTLRCSFYVKNHLARRRNEGLFIAVLRSPRILKYCTGMRSKTWTCLEAVEWSVATSW